MFNKKTESTLAIDLAPEAVKVLDVKVQKDGPQVTSFASQPVEPGSARPCCPIWTARWACARNRC